MLKGKKYRKRSGEYLSSQNIFMSLANIIDITIISSSSSQLYFFLLFYLYLGHQCIMLYKDISTKTIKTQLFEIVETRKLGNHFILVIEQ